MSDKLKKALFPDKSQDGSPASTTEPDDGEEADGEGLRASDSWESDSDDGMDGYLTAHSAYASPHNSDDEAESDDDEPTFSNVVTSQNGGTMTVPLRAGGTNVIFNHPVVGGGTRVGVLQHSFQV